MMKWRIPQIGRVLLAVVLLTCTILAASSCVVEHGESTIDYQADPLDDLAIQVKRFSNDSGSYAGGIAASQGAREWLRKWNGRLHIIAIRKNYHGDVLWKVTVVYQRVSR